MQQFLSYVFSSVWAMYEPSAMGYLPLLNRMAEGTANIPQLSEEEKAGFAPRNEAANGANGRDVRIGVLPIQGPIVKYDMMCGPRGTKSIIRSLRNFKHSSDIGAVVMVIDSGGGEAAATQELAAEIKNFGKPIIAFVDGMAASAAYWIASAADEIILSQKTDIVGSIGTMINFLDLRGYYEKQGAKFHEIYATLSTSKNKAFQLALEGDYDQIRKELLDPFNNAFHAGIKANRSGKLNLEKHNVLDGSIFMGQKAIKAGLADRIDSFDNTLSRAANLATSEPKPNSSTHMTFKETIAKILGNGEQPTAEQLNQLQEQLDQARAEAQEAQGGADAAATQIAAITAERDQAQEQVTSLTSERDEARAQVESLTQERDTALAQIETLTQERDEARTLAEEYGAQPGAAPSKPNKKGNVEGDAGQNEPLPHEAEADATLWWMQKPDEN